MRKEIIVGLDIGTTKIAAIVGEKVDHGKINILGIGHVESGDAVSRGMVSNINKTVEAIRIAVEKASATSNVDIKVVQVGIAGQHIKCLHHRGQITKQNIDDEISKADLDRLMADMERIALDPGEQIIHIIPQDYIVDNDRGIKDPIGRSGVRLEGNFHIITGNTTAIKNMEKCVEKAGLSVDCLVLEPLASSESVLSAEEKEAGVALIDIGGGTTDLAIFEDGIIRHTAVIPLGGEVITNDIKVGCNVMTKQAEGMKIKFGSALVSETMDNEIIVIPGIKGRAPREISVKNLSHIIQARVEEIFENVFFEIKSSGYMKKLQGGIVLTGGGAQLKHLTQLVEYITGIDTRIGRPTEHLASGLVNEVKSPMYATGIGLLLYGFQNSEKTTAHEPRPKEHKKKGMFDFFAKTKEWLKDENDDFEKK